LGDACHATLPFLAHGAIMALEDAFVLARCLEAFGEEPAFALKRYEELRVKRCTDIVRGSAATGRRFHNPRLANHADAVSYVTTEWAPDLVKVRYDWLFEYDATTASLSEGAPSRAPAALLSH
jgi:salicylate hydroxylase